MYEDINFDYDYALGFFQPNFSTPESIKNGVVYQIFPERFRNGDTTNDPVGNGSSGDLLWAKWDDNGDGKIDRRDSSSNAYAKKQTNWFATPEGSSDWFGGDLQGIIDQAAYLKDLSGYLGKLNRNSDGTFTHDTAGSMNVYSNLSTMLSNHGINLIIDGVFNHSSANHPWFDRWKKSSVVGAYESQSSSYYDYYKFNTWNHEYVSWWGYKNIPELQEVQGFKDYVYNGTNSVIKYWNGYGLDGWRMDVANEVSHQFWSGFRPAYKTINSNGYLLAEEWGRATAYLLGDQFDGVMNYRFRDNVLNWLKENIDSTLFGENMLSVIEDYPRESLLASTNLLDSHDTTRVLNEFSGNKDKVKLAAMIQMTWPGVPMIYYGDEVGLAGGADPDNRRTYPWADLGGNPDTSMLQHYKALISIRKTYSVLRTGSLKMKYVSGDVVVVGREDASTNPDALTAYNRSTSNQTITISVSDMNIANGTVFKDVWNGVSYTVSSGNVTFTVPAGTAAILVS
ncbi:glycoside hydrolase family 13 protein [Cohnella sp.]|uniref:glycoside hydrolase family 13 protein n=1 Tax=Cohnella sp. TaxID=1883426 RepID=UPI003565BC63